MAFDTNAFLSAEFTQRTQEVSLPALQSWFTGKDEKPVFKVRGLNASEIARSNDTAKRNENIEAIIKSVTDKQGQVAKVMAELGISKDMPDDILKRLDQLVAGSVEPKFDYPLASKLAEVYPIEFYQLTNAILVLTGLGMDVVKQHPSGTTTELETA